MMTKILGLALATTALFGIASAHATPAEFGPATAALSTMFSPTVSLGATTSTIDVTAAFGNDYLINGTGDLSGTPFTGSSGGTITFSNTPYTIISNAISDLFVFDDGQGGTYNFSLLSSDTITYSVSDSTNQFGLYLLGTMTDANLGLVATNTSLTLTFNNTNGSAYSLSGSLSNPPVEAPVSPVPEPASILLLGAGLAGLGLARRKSGLAG